MTLTLYGVTSDGTSVPIEVTDDGKLVVDTSSADGFVKQGDDVEFGKGEFTGDIDVDGSATFDGVVTTGVSTTTEGTGSWIQPSGGVYTTRPSDSSDPLFAGYQENDLSPRISLNADGSADFAGNVVRGVYAANSNYAALRDGQIEVAKDTNDGNLSLLTGTRYDAGAGSTVFSIKTNGSAMFSENKCGFTSDGELFFTSRGSRYKLFVSNGMVQAESYTRQIQLKEKVDEFKSSKVDPREADPDEAVTTTDNDIA